MGGISSLNHKNTKKEPHRFLKTDAALFYCNPIHSFMPIL